MSVACVAATVAETSKPAAAAFSAAAATTVGAATSAAAIGAPLAMAKPTQAPIVFHAPGLAVSGGRNGGAIAELPVVVAVSDKGALFRVNLYLILFFLIFCIHNYMISRMILFCVYLLVAQITIAFKFSTRWAVFCTVLARTKYLVHSMKKQKKQKMCMFSEF